jgi:hypothetical protein
MKHKLLLFLLLTASVLAAERLELSIRYLGLPVVRVNMTYADSTLQVHAKATTVASIAARMNNYYTSIMAEDFLPRMYTKRITQKDYQEDREIIYYRRQGYAERTSRISESRNNTYPIDPTCRDFFSALYYLRTLSQDAGSFCLDACGLMWDASYSITERSTMNTALGKRKVRKIEMNFAKRGNKDKERSDMLTNNLVSDRTLFFWLTDDTEAIPVKAVFEMSPFSVVWRLDSYEK